MAYRGYESYAMGAYGMPAAPYGFPAAAPLAVPPYAAPMGGYGTDELRTVFITGFPNDIKERELNNLLRFIPGYEASQMNWKNGQAQGFALFCNGGAARAACDQIAGLCFDDNVNLRAEMAHKNMYIKDEPAPGSGGGAIKRARVSGGYTGASSGGGSYEPLKQQPSGQYGAVSNTKDNPPCNTLFVGNLGDTVDEAELNGIFASQPGFQQLKVLRSARNISCFVEFETVETAMQCHSTQQGAVLRSSSRGPIRIQFSKNPFGKKRDVNGQMIDTAQGGEPVPPEKAAALSTLYSGGIPGAGSGAYDGIVQNLH